MSSKQQASNESDPYVHPYPGEFPLMPREVFGRAYGNVTANDTIRGSHLEIPEFRSAFLANIAGEAYSCKFNDFNTGGIFGKHNYSGIDAPHCWPPTCLLAQPTQPI